MSMRLVLPVVVWFCVGPAWAAEGAPAERARRVRLGTTRVTVVDETKSRHLDEVFSRMRRKEANRQLREQRLADKAQRLTAKQGAREKKKAARAAKAPRATNPTRNK